MVLYPSIAQGFLRRDTLYKTDVATSSSLHPQKLQMLKLPWHGEKWMMGKHVHCLRFTMGSFPANFWHTSTALAVFTWGLHKAMLCTFVGSIHLFLSCCCLSVESHSMSSCRVAALNLYSCLGKPQNVPSALMYSVLTSSLWCFKTFRLVWCDSFQNKVFQKRENIKFHYNIWWCAAIHILKNYICLFYSCVYRCMWMYLCHRECIEVTGQRTRGVSSLLPTCAF